MHRLGAHHAWTASLGHLLVMAQTVASHVLPAPMPLLVAVLAAPPAALGNLPQAAPVAAMTAWLAPLLPTLVLPAVTNVGLAPGQQAEPNLAHLAGSVPQMQSAWRPHVTPPRAASSRQHRMAKCAGMI
jgi:hypothetical protein